ncbi:hypothetical protein BpHYR1_022746 [Brachionus plicatilis]|uniref:Uncharacterized protein n=1 Tax=Brachionus plicatilis TaxID=10195 RepID=A0A3M7P213_BRAPC|nr:hypothetical protein BpHYR1_022746 [Brachionus plicatilis]
MKLKSNLIIIIIIKNLFLSESETEESDLIKDDQSRYFRYITQGFTRCFAAGILRINKKEEFNLIIWIPEKRTCPKMHMWIWDGLLG